MYNADDTFILWYEVVIVIYKAIARGIKQKWQ
jgi:hypothetical protein